MPEPEFLYPSNDTIYAVKAPRFRWKPQLDITTYELALCLTPLFTHDGAEVERLPTYAKRHFEETK